MLLPERPQLRPHLAASPADSQRTHYLVWDQLRLSNSVLKITGLQLEWLQLLDGRHTLGEIRAHASSRIGVTIPLEQFERLARDLDTALFLDSPRYRQVSEGPVRPCNHLQQYEALPGGLRAVLEELFTRPGGPGLPGEPCPDGKLRAALVPHMDYARGGSTYAWAFKEVLERTDASLFVIVGTSHYSRQRFTLTRKHFQTPFGLVETDQAYIDRLVHLYGPGLFDDELAAHWPEHSIELEVAFLSWYYANRRPVRIVPLLVGSFHDCVQRNRAPHQEADIGRMIQAVRTMDAELKEPVCYLISGDLAHIGPKFNDPAPVSEAQLSRSRAQDQVLLKEAERADPLGYFQVIAQEGDQRRICGFPPTYTVLEALRPSGGRVLAYDQYVDRQKGHESVSFASVAFER